MQALIAPLASVMDVDPRVPPDRRHLRARKADVVQLARAHRPEIVHGFSCQATLAGPRLPPLRRGTQVSAADVEDRSKPSQSGCQAVLGAVQIRGSSSLKRGTSS